MPIALRAKTGQDDHDAFDERAERNLAELLCAVSDGLAHPAAIRVIRGPLYRAHILQPIDQSGHRRRVEPQPIGEPGRSRRNASSDRRWETDGGPVDPGFLELWAGSFAPTREWQLRLAQLLEFFELDRLTMPVLVFAAENSRQSRATFLAAAAERLRDARAVLVANATHFTVPQDHPEDINPDSPAS